MKKLIALVVMIALAIIIPATLLAWGPSRDTFTMEIPANHITFNSITDNPNIGGDERNFVGIRETGTNGLWTDNMTVAEGKSYDVRMYVHNDAESKLKLVAENVTARFNLPTNTAKSIQVNGFLNSTNATPNEVYDHATFNGSTEFNLSYVDNSLKYRNNHFTDGTPLPESIFTSTGARIGFDNLQGGKIPGCIYYAGYVSFTVKPQFTKTSNFTVSKTVSKHGLNQWVENYTAQPGELVDYMIEYKNIGQVQQDNVTVRDTLPAGQTYEMHSTSYRNGNHPTGTPASDNIANGIGINIGSYAPGANAKVIFSARVAKNNDLKNCGVNTLTNKAAVTTGNVTREDTAVVTVPKVCTPVVPPVVPPVTPGKLPYTGPGENIAALLGLGALITGIVYFVTSRRVSLKK